MVDFRSVHSVNGVQYTIVRMNNRVTVTSKLSGDSLSQEVTDSPELPASIACVRDLLRSGGVPGL